MTVPKKRRPRSKAEFVRLLWTSPQAEFDDDIPTALSYLIIPRDKYHTLIVSMDSALGDVTIPDWVWWPCYLTDRDEVEKLVNKSQVQYLPIDELRNTSQRYLDNLYDNPNDTPFT
jgi:hypothetical protein